LHNVLITTHPFGTADKKVLDLLHENKDSCNFSFNNNRRRLKEDELCEMIKDVDFIIAGTEPITKKVLSNANRLKLISRVGIGLDSVDLIEARNKGILVSYTPDAPTKAVAELTLGLMINLKRNIVDSDRDMRDNKWNRYLGDLISESVIGIIGTGRVGKSVIKLLKSFNPKRILVNDILPDHIFYKENSIELVTKSDMYCNSDIISIHVPITKLTRNMIGLTEFRMMHDNVCLINTSRGGIINENELYEFKKSKSIKVALDVYEEEPYTGNLLEYKDIIFTSHLGSCTNSCRGEMEYLATKEVMRFIKNESLQNLVPQNQYI